MKTHWLFGGLLAAGLIFPAATQAARPLHPRVTHQRVVIRHGVKSGALTAREAAALRHREQLDARRIHHVRRTGHTLTPRERAGMERALNRQHRRIHRMETNRRRR